MAPFWAFLPFFVIPSAQKKIRAELAAIYTLPSTVNVGKSYAEPNQRGVASVGIASSKFQSQKPIPFAKQDLDLKNTGHERVGDDSLIQTWSFQAQHYHAVPDDEIFFS